MIQRDAPVVTNRLREAREYVGFDIREAADFVGVYVQTLQDFEAGWLVPSHNAWEKLSRLYRRPVGWLRGEPASPVVIPEELDRLIEDKALSDHDRREIVGFVEWLAHAKESARAALQQEQG